MREREKEERAREGARGVERLSGLHSHIIGWQTVIRCKFLTSESAGASPHTPATLPLSTHPQTPQGVMSMQGCELESGSGDKQVDMWKIQLQDAPAQTHLSVTSIVSPKTAPIMCKFRFFFWTTQLLFNTSSADIPPLPVRKVHSNWKIYFAYLCKYAVVSRIVTLWRYNRKYLPRVFQYKRSTPPVIKH